MKVDLLIKNGTIVTPEDTFNGAVAIKDGKTVAVIYGNDNLPDATEVYDASGKHVLPGLIDAHVHWREPGIEYKEDFATGSIAAAFGGITSVIDMPNVKPPTSTVEALQMKIDAGIERCYIDFGVFAVLLQENYDDIIPLAKTNGIVGYKIFLGETIGNIPAPDDGMMLDAMRTVATTGLRIGYHAENKQMVDHATKKLKDAGITDPRCFPESRPNVSEEDAIRKVINFAEYTGCKVHIYHLACKEGVDLIRAAKARGIDITAETGPHYLLLDVDHYDKVGYKLKMNPPVRYKEDSEKLWEGILDESVEVLATDHSPHTREEKKLDEHKGDIWSAIAGFCGVESAVPLILTEVNKGRMTLNHYVKLASENPARVWGIYPQKGVLKPGSDGDVTIVDMNKEGIIKEEELHSKNKITPFDGFKVKGLPVATIVRGKFVMKDGQLVGDKSHGKLISPYKPVEIK